MKQGQTVGQQISEANRLKLAIQKSGRLAEQSLALLAKCGIKLVMSKDQLMCRDEDFPLDIFFVRDDDIPAFVAANACQIGIVGQNVFEEDRQTPKGSDTGKVSMLKELGFGKCRLAIAVPNGFAYDGPQSLGKKRIATSYPRLLRSFLDENDIQAEIILMQGAVEVAPRMHLADAVCDLVSTGSTLEKNGLCEAEVILRSQTILIGNNTISTQQQSALDRLMLRIEGVQKAQNNKYIMLHCPVDRLDALKQVLPGSDSPTVLTLQGRTDKVAVHAMCQENIFWNTMENLKAIGASDILVVPIEKVLD